MRLLHSVEGSIAKRFTENLAPILGDQSNLDCLVLFSIRGDDRLPESIFPLLRSLHGKRTAFVVFGDFTKEPDGDHSVASGLREWVKMNCSECIYWVDTLVINQSEQTKKIASWAAKMQKSAIIRGEPKAFDEKDAYELICYRLDQSIHKLDLSDGEMYDRSLWSKLSPRDAQEIIQRISMDENIKAINLGWVAGIYPPLTLPAKLKVFRGRGIRNFQEWLDFSPPLEELVLVGGAIPSIKIPSRTRLTLRRLVLDKNALTNLPNEIADAPLSILSLLRNNFQKVPEEIRKLNELESLTIGANNISVLPDWLIDMPRLRTLDLSLLQLNNSSKTIVEELRAKDILVRCRKVRFGNDWEPYLDSEVEFPRLSKF